MLSGPHLFKEGLVQSSAHAVWQHDELYALPAPFSPCFASWGSLFLKVTRPFKAEPYTLSLILLNGASFGGCFA